MTSKTIDINTLAQHGGSEFRVGRGLIGAVERSVTFSTPTLQEPPVYSRLGNTNNHRELESMLATLEGGDEAIAVNSGMSALTLLFFTLARPGDHVLCPDVCYGGTNNFLAKVLTHWGVTTTFAPISEWNNALTPKTKFVICESISNPFCIPQDIASVSDFAKRHNLISICDNTFASPVLCKPLKFGFDYVMESATKFLNGHADVIAGMVSGSRAAMAPLRTSHSYLGTFLPPDQCAMLLRGIRTLKLRVDQHSRNAEAVSEALRVMPEVDRVYYGSSNRELSFTEGFGGMIGVVFKKSVSMEAFMKGFKLIKDVPSLGSTESTATVPAFTTNWFMSEDERKKFGIESHLVRFSIGLESPNDLIADIRQSLNQSVVGP